jgi:hypothetical protein
MQTKDVALSRISIEFVKQKTIESRCQACGNIVPVPSQHSLVPSHRNVHLFDRKLMITPFKFYLCQTSNSHTNPTKFTNAWPVNANEWAFHTPYVTANETHPPLPPAGVHGSPSVAGTPYTGPTFGCFPAMHSPNAESSGYLKRCIYNAAIKSITR